jgi:hypothetical protein
VQLSTIGEAATRRCAELANRSGVGFVDAPVPGTREPAQEGKLVVLESGLEEARPPPYSALIEKKPTRSTVTKDQPASAASGPTDRQCRRAAQAIANAIAFRRVHTGNALARARRNEYLNSGIPSKVSFGYTSSLAEEISSHGGSVHGMSRRVTNGAGEG